MKRTMLAVLAIGLLIAADGAKDDAKKDQETVKDPLQGTWKGVSWEAGGNPLPDDFIKNLEFIVKGDQYTVKHKGEEIEQGTFKVDPAKKPKTIDFKITKGPDAGKNQQGIYEVDKDSFKICVAVAGKDDRPKEMSAKAGTEHALVVFKRAK